MEIKDLITYTKGISGEGSLYIPIFPKICFRSFRISEKTGDFGIVLPSGGNV